jgi:acyl carrier protein
MNEKEKLLSILNDVLTNNNLKKINTLNIDDSLRDDLGLDSLALAELTVKIESEFGIDIFEDEIIETVGEVIKKTDV